ncbi:uncharacterized protein A1O9_12780 [Exophiala aquamarina CBS 119918]|uniref:Protein-lysine N-methyltransferase EFM6 n=1 Tax=Exophiala aquamarina CBS 119918 TaxID=1182545 RepID=A0A072NU58_9EURO|nr:uncharacterized protein A1O9_12780 [Exophiala aquamarina CBS 119918]KEF51166.1 hypothetical protein A1O9_12780 [Exophiala aquamarina CBS 119918]
MLASRSPSPDNDVLAISTALIPERAAKPAATSTITFGNLLPLTRALVLHEDLQEGCGGQLWPAGMVLAKYMLQYHKISLKDKTVLEIGAGGGLVGLAVALGCEFAGSEDHKLYITDQIPMLALMKKNIAMNHVGDRVEALVYDWGTPPPDKVLRNTGETTQHPDIVLAADCVYFEPTFPLLLQTMGDLIGPDTVCYFCFKKRRKADMRFIRDMKKKFAVDAIQYDSREVDQRQGIFLYHVRMKPGTSSSKKN